MINSVIKVQLEVPTNMFNTRDMFNTYGMFNTCDQFKM